MSNDILTVISVMGQIRIEKFKVIYDTLLKYNYNEDEQQRLLYSHYDVLRDLETLGYCEIDYTSRIITACPPSYALLPSRGLPKIVLGGGRSHEMIQQLMRLESKNPDKINIIFSDQLSVKYPLFPQTIYIEAKSIGILKKVTKILKTEGNLDTDTPWHLAVASPSLKDINDSLLFNKKLEPNWKKKSFCSEKLYFKQFDCYDELRLVKYTNPISQQQYTWIWDKGAASNIDRSWGRYIILSNKKIKVLLFDKVKHRFAVPSTIPLPKQLSRAATLCTGNLPRQKVLRKQVRHLALNTNLTVYEAVDELIALEISKKLGQDLLEANL